MGPFWGFQEAWLSLAASVFDMAIYPTTFVLYLSHIAPTLTAGSRGLLIKLGIVGISARLESLRSCSRGTRLPAHDGHLAITLRRPHRASQSGTVFATEWPSQQAAHPQK